MIARWSSRLTAAVAIGLALLCASKLEAPKMARIDFVSDALWGGCKLQAMNRISSLWK